LILGIDPGSIRMGYALLSNTGEVKTGTLRLGKGLDLAHKTGAIFSFVKDLIERKGVKQMAMEKFFYHKDPRALAIISHCRGAAMAAATLADVPVFEYSPMEIKKAVVGYGHATKEQMAWVLKQTLNIPDDPPPDETDALAVALCHLARCRARTYTEEG